MYLTFLFFFLNVVLIASIVRNKKKRMNDASMYKREITALKKEKSDLQCEVLIYVQLLNQKDNDQSNNN